MNHVVAHDDLSPAPRSSPRDIVGNDQAAVRNLKKLYDANEKVTVGDGDRPGAGILPRVAHRPGARSNAGARASSTGAAASSDARAERFEAHMSDSDALMWNIEKDPLLRSTIVTVLLLDRAPDWDRLVDKIERGTWMIPRMRQRVATPLLRMGPPQWSGDPNFDLRYHLRRVRRASRATSTRCSISPAPPRWPASTAPARSGSTPSSRGSKAASRR